MWKWKDFLKGLPVLGHRRWEREMTTSNWLNGYSFRVKQYEWVLYYDNQYTFLQINNCNVSKVHSLVLWHALLIISLKSVDVDRTFASLVANWGKWHFLSAYTNQPLRVRPLHFFFVGYTQQVPHSPTEWNPTHLLNKSPLQLEPRANLVEHWTTHIYTHTQQSSLSYNLP